MSNLPNQNMGSLTMEGLVTVMSLSVVEVCWPSGGGGCGGAIEEEEAPGFIIYNMQN